MVNPEKQLFDASGAHPALNLVNSLDRTVDQQAPETLLTYGDLILWSRQAGLLDEARAAELVQVGEVQRPREGRAVLRRAWALREAVFDIFTALLQGERAPADAIEILNREVGEALARTRLAECGEGYGWSFVRVPLRLDEPLWPLARAAAELLVSERRHQVRQCAADTCLWLFLDCTKNHRRRWCDMKLCGNRAKVRRHRDRRRAEDAEGRDAR